MTPKPQSVCKWCDKPKEHAVHGKFANSWQHPFEPVAEPAEPSASPDVNEMRKSSEESISMYTPVSAEPIAEGPYANWEPGDAIPSPAGKYAPPAQQPVAGERPQCTCNNLPHYWNCHMVLLAPETTSKLEKKYIIAIRWFKLFYDFYQKDIEGKPSAAMSAMLKDEELQELLREADRVG